MLPSAQIKCRLEGDEAGKGCVFVQRSKYLQYRDFSILIRPASKIAEDRIEMA
ncbi:hypothetical protein ES705_39936 [subsurface metagenome]